MNKQFAALVAALVMMVLSPSVSAEELDAWGAAKLMGVGVNIGNTLENTTTWETGWGNPRVTREYVENITKTTSADYVLPVDAVPHRLLISVHYYTPWQFAGMTQDESWGKMAPTWGSAADVAELNRLFDAMQEFCKSNDLPAFIGEFGVTDKKETASRVRWMTAVAEAALSRKMIPVLWETGGDISRKPPYAPSPALREVLEKL